MGIPGAEKMIAASGRPTGNCVHSSHDVVPSGAQRMLDPSSYRCSSPGFRWLLLRAVAIGRRREALKDTTLAQYRADLDRRLDRLLSGPAPKQK
jgi:hypothetical protein